MNFFWWMRLKFTIATRHFDSESHTLLVNQNFVEMARAESRYNREHDMGQISSQLAQTEPANHVATKGTARKSKQKKRKQEEPQEEAATEEQAVNPERESAQALVQLAQGSNAKAGTPQNGEGPPVTPIRYSRHSGHRYGPDMTSQDILSQELSSEGRTTKRLKTRSKKKKIREALRSDIQSLQALYQDEPSTPATQRATTPIAEFPIPRQQPSHPLDDVSTDEDVEEIAEGTQDVHQSGRARNEIPETSPVRSGAGLSETCTSPAGLPAYSASQRQRALEESGFASRSTSKRKRVAERGAGTSAAAVESQVWPQAAFGSSTPPQEDETALEENMQAGPDSLPQELHQGPTHSVNAEELMMAIDPVLSNMGPSALNRRSPVENGQLRGLNGKRASVSKKSGKKRRIDDVAVPVYEPAENNDEVPYYSPYASHRNQDQQEMATMPIDDELGRSHSTGIKTSRKKSRLPKGTPSGQGGARTENKSLSGAEDVQNIDPIQRKQEISNAKGHLGPQEYALVEAYRDNYCREHGIGHREFNVLIQSQIRGNPHIKAMFNDFQELFPGQRITYIQRALRRKFHNFSARGTWTAEEDEELKNAVAEKGTSWKAVGEMIERYPEDCRDRWRNYLTRENRVTDQWTDAELLNLASAIYDCVQTMKVERRQSKVAKYGDNAPYSDDEWEEDVAPLKLLNWQAVSDRMGVHGGTRSRLQCSSKWGKIKEEDRERLLRNVRTSQPSQDLLGQADGHLNPASWRIKKASKKVVHMLAGDRYDLLQLILHSGAPTEGNIPWRLLGEPWWQERWTVTERKAAWLMMKSELPNAENMDYRDIVYHVMTPLLEQDLSQRWDPANYKSTPDPRAGQRKQGKVGKKTKQGKVKRKRKSNSRVHSSDSEHEIFLSSEQQQHTLNGQPTPGDDSSDDNDDPSNQAPFPQATSGAAVLPGVYHNFDPSLTPNTRKRNKRHGSRGDAGENDNVDDDLDSLFEEDEEQDGDSFQDAAYHDARVAPELARQVLSLQDVA